MTPQRTARLLFVLFLALALPFGARAQQAERRRYAHHEA